mmetsp:Transcript_10712/g.24411  ORF Transcript_10712/g.24411 Transcript_10712/m.24411 type:complete len:218 (-) Transcript_10712:399-1052(-)
MPSAHHTILRVHSRRGGQHWEDLAQDPVCRSHHTTVGNSPAYFGDICSNVGQHGLPAHGSSDRHYYPIHLVSEADDVGRLEGPFIPRGCQHVCRSSPCKLTESSDLSSSLMSHALRRCCGSQEGGTSVSTAATHHLAICCAGKERGERSSGQKAPREYTLVCTAKSRVAAGRNHEVVVLIAYRKLLESLKMILIAELMLRVQPKCQAWIKSHTGDVR